MSNTIKLKRGSSSDPGASDLVVGEVALRTDNGRLFTKKDDGSVVQIGGGAGAIDDDAVTTAKIADGAVTNAKVASDAAIAGTKISPDFGSQNIVTTGALDVVGITIGGNTPSLNFTDANDNPDFRFLVNSNSFILEDTTNSANRLIIDSDGDLLHGVTSSEDTTGNSGTKLITAGDLQIDGDQKVLLFRSSANTAQKQSGIQWWNENGAGVQCAIFGIREAVSSAPGALAFYTSADVDTTANGGEGDITERLRITSAGNVGIGETSPTNNLHLGASGADQKRSIKIDGTNGSSELQGVILESDGENANFNIKIGVGGGTPATKLSITNGGAIVTGDLDITGTFSSAGNIKTGTDTGKFFAGASNDLQLYHDGTDSFITNSTGTLKIQTQVNIDKGDGSAHIARFIPDGSVELYESGTKRFETKSYGAFINGHLQMDDNNIIKLGNSNDLQIYHDASDSIINDSGTGDLKLQVGGSTKLKVTSAGITVQGSQEPQIIIQDSDSGNTGNAAETGISFRDGGGTQQGIMGFSNSGDQDFYFDTASTSGEMNFRVGGSTTQFKVDNGGIDVTGTCTATTFSGSGASLTSLNASNISSGTIPAARVGDITGNAASADTVDLSGISTNSEKQVVVSNNNDGAGRTLCVDSSSSAFTYNPSTNVLTASGGFSTSGNITVSGTVDGRDVASDGSKLDGIESGANNYSFPYTVSVSSSGSSVVQRHSSGHIFANYYHGTGTFSTSGNTSGMARFTGTNGSDNYGRSYTAAAARALLNVADGATNVTNNNQLSNGAGYITSGSDRACQAWVNFNGSNGGKRDDLNVSSVDDNGVGQYTVNFASSMPNDDYCIVNGYLTSQGNANTVKITSQSTGSFSLKTGSFQDGSSNTNRDFTAVYCAVFSD